MFRIKLSSAIIFVILVSLIKGSNSFRWEDEDSVVVEAYKPGDWEKQNFQRKWPFINIRSRAEASDEFPCYTTSGQQGFCSQIKDCYPSLFTDVIENQAMLETLKAMAGPCDTTHFSSFRIDLPEGLICCTIQKPEAEATPRPMPFTRPTRPTTEFTTSKKLSNITTSTAVPENNHIPDAVAALLYQHRFPTCGIMNETLEKDGKRFPWIVALVGGHGHFCAGSLIDRYFVLTSAQCVNQMTSEEIGNIRVFLGDYKLHTTVDGPAIIRKVARVIYHRSFNEDTLKNDIALLKFKLPAPIGTDKVSPICLPDKKQRFEDPDEQIEHETTLAGWGRSWIPSPTPVLRRTSMTIWTNENCRLKYGYLAKNGISESMICAAADGRGRNEVSDCIGDSGGPLFSEKDGISHLIGLVSWNIGCGNFPYVHTRVSSYIPWIEKNMLRR